ncbi:hypothetical protein EDD86DRAFT_220804 [Gorgonomyces haynaldii]|nr:hypothetical protein EDD86DRAFT_220804 [Gorgonomyces haynaldii]
MKILQLWNQITSIPLIGKFIFRILIGWFSPYTGSLGMVVDSMSKGKCKAWMRDSWSIRNPFKSVHAAALVNFGEAVGGMAVLTYLEANGGKAIVSRIEIDYLKKARGTLTAVASVESMVKGENLVYTQILNQQNEVVAKMTCVWTMQ